MLVLVVCGGRGVVAAGAVDKDVAGAQVGKDLLMHFFQKSAVQNVGLVGHADEAFRFDLGRELFHRVFVQIQGCHLCAGLGKSLCHGAAQNAPGACDHYYLACKINI